MTSRITDEFLEYKHVMVSILNKLQPYASQQDIEDILQETYINVYEYSINKEIFFPKAFMMKSAIRLANKSLNKAQHIELKANVFDYLDQEAIDLDTTGTFKSVEEKVSDLEECNRLYQTINQLPNKCRVVFILKKIYGFSQKEIAEKLSISVSTVEKHVAKGLFRTQTNYQNSLL